MTDSNTRREERAQRVKIRLPLQLQLEGAEITIEAETLNVSTTGMLVATNMPLEAGTQVEISVALADGQVLFETTGVVVRQQWEPDIPCVGIRFKTLSPQAAELISRLAAEEVQFGNYRLEAMIGRGGMAEVFRGRQIGGRHLGRTVAIKRLLPNLSSDPVFRDLFITEADVTRTLRHPSIVDVFETGEIADSLYIAMEYVHGGNLSQLLQACRQFHQRLPIELACHIVICVTSALDYAHQARGPNGTPLGIIHCDVAPNNIFVSYAGEVKLADFGVAHMNAIPGPVEGRVLVGRPQYRAPEQILFKPLSPAVDIFALGAVLFELLTLHEAFAGKNVEEIHRKITTGMVVPPSAYRPEIPGELEQIVLRALSLQIQGMVQPWWAGLRGERHELERYPDALSFGQSLSRYCHPPEQSQNALREFLCSLRPQ